MFSPKAHSSVTFSPVATLHNAVSSLYFHLETLYLFTRSDFKTIVVPITLFTFAAAPSVSFSRLPHVVFWLWLHLLKLCVSNQYLGPHEDALNKPWRPIPSGRISIHATKMLGLALFPICFLVSALYDVLGISVFFVILAWSYNEGGLHSAWVVKQICNSLGYGSLEMGATVIMANIVALDKISYTAVAMSSLVILTTGWAQDFADQDGDRLQGNITVPILAPRAARVLFPVALLLWAMTLITVWELGVHIAIPFIVFTVIVGGRFWFFRDTKEDEISFVFYNVWLATVHLLPFINRTHLENVPHPDFTWLFQRKPYLYAGIWHSGI